MFKLAMPWALSLLLLPVLIWFFCKPAQWLRVSGMRLPFVQEIASLSQPSIRQNSTKLLLFFSLLWSLLVLAASNPQWVGEPLPLQREGRNLMMVMDLSGSMDLRDMMVNGQPLSRLTVVKKAAKQFVKMRSGDKIGLILFGSQAYLQTPLTYDHENVLTRINDAVPGLAGNTTSIGDALGLAIKRLEPVPRKSRVIILLTDGANNSGVLTPDKAAELVALSGTKVYTIGLGADTSSSRSGWGGFYINSGAELDEDALKDIAQKTGGQYFRATNGKSLEAIYAKINTLETVSEEAATIRPRKDYYPWILGLASCLLLIYLIQQLGRRRTW